MPGPLASCELQPPFVSLKYRFLLGLVGLLATDTILIQGSKDAIWPDVIATEQIKLFTSSPSANATIILGGSHFLNVTQAEEVNSALLDFVKRYS